LEILAVRVNRRQSRPQRQGVDASAEGIYERVATHIKCLRPALERVKGGRDILRLSDFELVDDVEAELAGRDLNLIRLSTAAG
jgi:hypothetical protein